MRTNNNNNVTIIRKVKANKCTCKRVNIIMMITKAVFLFFYVVNLNTYRQGLDLELARPQAPLSPYKSSRRAGLGGRSFIHLLYMKPTEYIIKTLKIKTSYQSHSVASERACESVVCELTVGKLADVEYT